MKKLLIALAASALFAFSASAQELYEGVMSEQEKVIDELFNALNDKDLDALEKTTMPKEFITEENSYTKCIPAWYQKILWSFGIRDFLLNTDYLFFLECKTYLKDFYTFDPEYYGGHDKMYEALHDPKRIKEVYKNFRLSYKIEDMCHFEDCNLYAHRLGRGDQIDDMDSIIYIGWEKLDVDDLYIAKVNLTWWWGNAKNGWNDEWLKDEEYNKIYGEKHNKLSKEDQYGLYFVYKYKGNWYVSKEIERYEYERK